MIAGTGNKILAKGLGAQELDSSPMEPWELKFDGGYTAYLHCAGRKHALVRAAQELPDKKLVSAEPLSRRGQ